MATYTRRYETSEDVKKKEQAYRDALAAVPTYTSQYQPQIDSLRDSIVNREGFKYDVNADAMYQQLRDQYQQQGRMAMMDTIGQTTALTGGYGNSYAQNAGQQAYHGYLMNLNSQIPDLYNMALNRYAQEGDDMARNYSLLLNQEAQDYGRWQDQYDQWQTGLNRLYSEYQTAADADYNRFRDEVADDKWQTEYDLALGAASGVGSVGDSGSDTGNTGGDGNPGVNTDGFGRYALALFDMFESNENGKYDTYSARKAELDYYKNAGHINSQEYNALLNAFGENPNQNRTPEKKYTNGKTESQIAADAAAYFDAHPDVGLDSRTLSNWLSANGYTSADGSADLFKAYLEMAGAGLTYSTPPKRNISSDTGFRTNLSTNFRTVR